MKSTVSFYKILFILMLCGLASQAQTVIPLWAKGAPGFENRRNEPEQAKDYWVKNIHNPSITVYLPPADKANGAAVVICPGGGHRLLVFNAEGVAPAKFYNELGVAVFILKYRLGRDTLSPYKVDIHPKQDAYRAMRLVRSRAAEFHIDTNRIGMMGFSAGGEVVDMVAFSGWQGDTKAADPIDRGNAKPNFIVQVYPGPGFVPEKIPADAPPAFLVAANDDACCSLPIIQLLQRYREAKVPVEMHMYARGDHAFNMGNNRKLKSINNWPQRLADWLEDSNILQPERKKVLH
ncbi:MULTISPECIES: alpha/beta hydrolase [unclassified Mucilaginibacter]|uniref:alpha/beta hydrolase n=1 Tax=unclassified Mucilaginibacter TaxID=2617802 RepID=UPI002AC9E5D9|nr:MULTISPECIES: alpha/beta hydrolase [unclassified Mucilaginibacter]MEB0262853.1 alpha/beta hydrolase [Mucilaginibacter sp. 10I4]MEB0277692.1 alpha/beta hydrolase [Mucilaginibacter sp. 10B2]MEB0301951.1 alpha/beta hydrolase [Mucilaginibacter sp. 5C4]WPX24681.1 alpha/beta hydrolase [Mucilaginibacter sp. 5C4]